MCVGGCAAAPCAQFASATPLYVARLRIHIQFALPGRLPGADELQREWQTDDVSSIKASNQESVLEARTRSAGTSRNCRNDVPWRYRVIYRQIANKYHGWLRMKRRKTMANCIMMLDIPSCLRRMRTPARRSAVST